VVTGPGAPGGELVGEKQVQPAAEIIIHPSLTDVFLAEEMLAGVSIEQIASQALEHLHGAQQALKNDLGSEVLSEFYRQVMLECIDERWVDYLTSLEELRYEVRLEGMAHNDPLVIYKSKASQAYSKLLADLRSVSVALMFQPLAAAGLVGTSQASASEKPAPRLTYLKLG
jgi:preprotein translocase subunit SecA